MRPREQKEFTFRNPGWHRRRLLSFDFLYHRNTVTEKVHSLPRLKEVLKQINLIIILIIFIINFFFLSVFHLGEEWFPSQPSDSIRETGDFFSNSNLLSYYYFCHHFSRGYSPSLVKLIYETAKLNTWLSRIIASGCSFASPTAPGGRGSGRHVKHMPSGWAQLPTVRCCHVG